jgi:hypothetical protein
MSPETRARLRIAIPLVLAAVCLIVAGFTSTLVTAVLVFAGFGLFLDVATLLFSRGGRIGEHRQ